MELNQKKCRHCSMLIPAAVEVCPYCKKGVGWTMITKIGVGFLCLFFAVIIVGTIIGPREEEKTPEQIKMEQAEARKKDLQRHFSAWDGSHNGLTRYIKDAMNDPGSYEHAKTVYWDRKDHLVVMTTFRGKNAFGGIVKSSVKAKVDLSGNVLEIVETQP